MTTNNTDQLLFEAIKHGDEHAFEILFVSHYKNLCNSSNKIVHDISIAQELVSDVFFTIWCKREVLEITSNLSGYLHFATRNHSLNYLKKKKTGMVDLDEVSEKLSSSSESPLELLMAVEYMDALESKIQQLPSERQKVFRMNRFEGLTYQEIARKLGLSEQTVRNQVSAAVKTLSSAIYAMIVMLFR